MLLLREQAAPYDQSGMNAAAPPDLTSSDPPAGRAGGRGWGQSTVRAILQNERYVGRWVWNKRKFIRRPNEKNRRAVLRPREEWRVQEHPELAIVPSDLWQQVQERFKTRKTFSRGRAPGEGRVPHLLSGMLRCGRCNSHLSIISAKMKNGVRYANYGCSAYHTKGKTICANGLCVSERKVTTAVIDTIRGMLADATAIKRFVDRCTARLAESEKQPSPIEELDREIAAAERVARNLADAVGQAGWSQTLGERLREQEARLSQLRARRLTLEAQAARPAPLPRPEALTAHPRDLATVLEKQPERSQAILRKHVGTITLTPQGEGPDRCYLATGAFDVSVLVKTSCGGRI